MLRSGSGTVSSTQVFERFKLDGTDRAVRAGFQSSVQYCITPSRDVVIQCPCDQLMLPSCGVTVGERKKANEQQHSHRAHCSPNTYVVHHRAEVHLHDVVHLAAQLHTQIAGDRWIERLLHRVRIIVLEAEDEVAQQLVPLAVPVVVGVDLQAQRAVLVLGVVEPELGQQFAQLVEREPIVARPELLMQLIDLFACHETVNFPVRIGGGESAGHFDGRCTFTCVLRLVAAVA